MSRIMTKADAYIDAQLSSFADYPLLQELNSA